MKHLIQKLKEHAPTMITRRVPNEFIGALIGPGGKVIQEMQKETGDNYRY